MDRLRMNLVAVCVVLAMVFSGCISIESTRAQLASGDPEQVRQAKDNIVYVAAKGGNQNRSYSMSERMSFLDLATDNDLLFQIADETSDAQIQLVALKKIDSKKPGIAAKVLKRFRGKFCEQLSSCAGSLDAIPDLLYGDPQDGIDEFPYVPIAKELVVSMSDKELFSLIRRDGDHWIDEVGRLVSARIRRDIQSPDLLCRVLIGEAGDLTPDDRREIEDRLLPNVDKANMRLVSMMLSENNPGGYNYSGGRLGCVSSKKLAAKLIERLPNTQEEAIAEKKRSAVIRWSSGFSANNSVNDSDILTNEQFTLNMIGHLDYGDWWKGHDDFFEYAIISATIIKDPKLAVKVADKIFDKINLPQFDDKNITRGEELMRHLVELAGKDWLVATLAKIDRKMPSFLKKQVSPEVATEVLCKGAVKSSYVEDYLAEKVPAEKITKEMCNVVKSSTAKATLMKRIPQSVKDALVASEKKAVERILAGAKAKEGTTFVLGGFYLGMPIDDAAILLRHYVGLKWDVGTIVLDNGMPAIKFGGQRDDYFALAYSDTKTVRDFNFGPWILRKFCDYDAQNQVQWMVAFNKDKGLNMVPDMIEKRDLVEIDGKEYPVSLVQSIVHYRSSKAGYRLTYFGKRDFVTEATGITSNALEDIGEMMLQAKAVLHFRYISAHEGTLRAQIWKD